MDKSIKTIIVIVIIVLIAAGLVFLAKTYGFRFSASNSPNGVTEVQLPKLEQPPVTEVSISNFLFAPSSLTVKVGTIVRWTNKDSASHQIKFADFSSEILNRGGAYEAPFVTPGTYEYSCAIHPSMKGTIIVEP